MARPSKFREDEYPEQIKRMAGLGLPLKDIAHILGVVPSTMDEWVKRPDVIGLYKEGRALGHENTSKRLYQLINENNLYAIQFYLKTQYHKIWNPKPEEIHPNEIERADNKSGTSDGGTNSSDAFKELFSKAIDMLRGDAERGG